MTQKMHNFQYQIFVVVIIVIENVPNLKKKNFIKKSTKLPFSSLRACCNMIDVHQTYDFGSQNDRVLLLLQK